MNNTVDDAVRVLLVDDQELVRTGLRGILRPRFGFEVVGELDSGEEIVETVARPPRGGHGRAHAEGRRRHGDPPAGRRPRVPPVLVLTTFEDDEILAGALRAGAAGFLLKVPAEDLQRRPGGRGRRLLARPRRHRSGARHLPRRHRACSPLTRARRADPREREVLSLIGAGLSNHEIADHLVLGEGTVKTHIGHLFAKLDLRDRAAAVVFAFDHGLVQPRHDR